MVRACELDVKLSGFIKAGHFDYVNNYHLLKNTLYHRVLSYMWKHMKQSWLHEFFPELFVIVIDIPSSHQYSVFNKPQSSMPSETEISVVY
jgi:hypothetical protein